MLCIEVKHIKLFALHVKSELGNVHDYNLCLKICVFRGRSLLLFFFLIL
jgi:hypothetical protein